MAQYTPTYRLGYFKRGSLYSAAIDYKRFVTLDYNMEDYVGIVGVGVISGWTIEPTGNPLEVKILPGSGMINGFYSESEYEFKRRSSMVMGEREVEIVNDDKIPESPLVEPYRSQYIAIIQDYSPNYSPSPSTPIINSWVKVVNPNIGNNVVPLSDNADSYIVAERDFTTPEDCWNGPGYEPPPEIGEKPSQRSYPTYIAYKTAMDAYNANVQTLNNYKWRGTLDNHFTRVIFSVSSSYYKSNDKVLVGKVVTRLGQIKKIDYKQVDNLENLEASIREQSKTYIAGHIHGGNKSYDPPKINLKTDIRRCVLYSYNSSGQVSTFDILENSETSVSVGHKHTYKIDALGSGYTVEVIGSNVNHFHKISNWTVGNQEFTTQTIQTHKHTITSDSSDVFSNVNTAYVVYINGVPATNNVSVDLANKKLSIFGLMGEVYKTYYVSFPVTYRDMATNALNVATYTFEKSSPNILSFMTSMETDFSNTYTYEQMVDETGSVIDTSRHPFLFTLPDGGLDGFNDLRSQCTIAQTLLEKVGEVYTFTSNAAKNITVLLKDSSSTSLVDYEVKIEVLENTEVTGILRDENIAFISAEKFKTGIFDIARIPFINHVGRMGEEFIPFQYPLVSTDGIKYSVSPSITTATYDHYHKLFLDTTDSGVTRNTYVSDEPVYYSYANGASYLIKHTHGVGDNVVLESSSRDMAVWQNALHGTNVNPIHTHSVIHSVRGDPKVIYALAETSNEDILAGTSSGLYIIPNDNAYLFVINGVKIYEIGNGLWDDLLKAKAEYEAQTGKALIVTEDIYLDSIIKAESALQADGDSVFLLGYTSEIGQDQVMIQKTESFLLPYFKYKSTKALSEVESDEKILNIQLVFRSNGNPVTTDDITYYLTDLESGGEEAFLTETVEIATVEKDLHDVPIWSITTDIDGNVFVCGATLYSKNFNLEKNLYTSWSKATKPNNTSSLRKAYKDSQDNIWFPTENGLMVARDYQNGSVIENTSNHGFKINVNDVVEGTNADIYIAGASGVDRSLDYGKTWIQVLEISGGCTKILKDIISGYLYAITSYLSIYKSNNGSIWELIGSMIDQEFGNIIAFNGYFYVCTSNGLYRSLIGSAWVKVLDEPTYSLGVLMTNSGILVGCDKNVYLTLDGEIYNKIFSIDGAAAPSLYAQNTRKWFGYAYGSKDQQFFFDKLTYTENSMSSLVDFSNWIAKNGAWEDSSPVDIYINRQLIYSTKKSIDIRNETNYNFSVSPLQGILNFGSQTYLSENTNVYSEFVSVEDSTGFGTGDRVYIVYTGNIPPKPQKSDKLLQLFNYYTDLIEWYKKKTTLENMYFYAEVSGVSSGRIFLDKNVDKNVILPATVYKIPNVSGLTPIFSNIYDSMISNIGTNNHEELDDKLTYITDNRPYLLNNSYLSNLLQLTQAVKYVYPGIDDYMVKSKFFDFKYSWNPIDPNYIGDEIDLSNSEAYNEGLYDSEFVSNSSRMVNKILIGHGDFDGMIIVGTDIGIFYAKLTDSLEANWFYTYNLRLPVYDLLISNNKNLLAATSNGIFESEDVVNWTSPDQPSITFPVYTLSYRWTGRETVLISNHDANFLNVGGKGKIIASSSLYGSIQPYRIIKITGDTVDTFDGNYSTYSVSDTEIVLNEEFPEGSLPILITVKIEMGAWWEYLSGDVSSENQNIKNTLMAGGRSMIAFATNVSSTLTSNEIIWRQSEFPIDLPKFSTSDILPLTNGLVLSSISGVSTNEENNLLGCNGSGIQWFRYIKMGAVRGTILNKEATSFGHVILKVNYTFPLPHISVDYSQNLKEIGFFDGAELLLKTYVLSNEVRNGNQYVTVFGQDIMDIVNKYPNVTFVIYPSKINKIIELPNKNVFFGTNQGLFSDDGTAVNYTLKYGGINKVCDNGIVTKIDTNGIISSVSSNPTYKNVVLNILTSDSITTNQLINSLLYVTDLNDPIGYKILSNTSLGVTGEVTIEIETEFNSNWNAYRTKKVTIVGTQSVVYIAFDSPISIDQFKDGKIYISSDENDNFGNIYEIESNTSQNVKLKTAIVPRSNFVMNNDSLIVGQSLKIIDSTNRIKLYVTFDDAQIETNQYAGYNFRLEETFGETTLSGMEFSVYSNTPYELVLNPITISTGAVHPSLDMSEADTFVISGKFFVPSQGFQNKITTISSDHYHDVSLINQKLMGTLDTITPNSSAYMDITITDPDGFDSTALLSDGTIIDKCKVILYNPANSAFSYETTSVSYVGGILRLNVSNQSQWSASIYQETKISPSWKFEIESKYCGLTTSIHYQDFGVITVPLTADLVEGETNVTISSTVGINNGDKVKLFDINGKTLISYVSNVIDIQNIQIDTPCDNTYLVSSDSGIKVIRDDFSNYHTHKISNTQVETLVVQDYLNLGYPSNHSHRLSPYIYDVSDITTDTNRFLAVGSSEIIYVSYNSGIDWEALIGLNMSLEWSDEVAGVSRIINNNGQIIVGTTNGQIFSNTHKGWTDIPLEKP